MSRTPFSAAPRARRADRKSTRLNSSHVEISYAVFCLKKKKRSASGPYRRCTYSRKAASFIEPFLFNETATTEIYTLSLHDALPICASCAPCCFQASKPPGPLPQVAACGPGGFERSEEHTSELQSRRDLVCRLLLEKKKKTENRLMTKKKKKQNKTNK